MARIDQLKALLKDDTAKARVKKLNALGEAAVKGAVSGDAKLAAYKQYVDKFYELKKQFPNWEERLDKPIEYSYFLSDYNEDLFKTIAASSEDFRGMRPIEVYTLKMHGLNFKAIDVLKQKLGELYPGSKWTNPEFFNSHVKEAFQLLRQHYPDDEEYDNIFSPKESRILFGE